MSNVFRTPCSYGIFSCFLHRLLLWRLSDETNDNTMDTVAKNQQWPSWSWMTYSRIEFLPVTQDLVVPPRSALRFDSAQVLFVQIRKLQNCTTKQEGSRHVVLDRVKKNVGELWFETTANTQFQRCVVVGVERDRQDDAEKIYHVLLVGERHSDSRYERVGLGQIKARCVSKESWEGRLF
jgi:hypothetical protein